MKKFRGMIRIAFLLAMTILFLWIILGLPALIYDSLEFTGISEQQSYAITEILIAISAIAVTSEGIYRTVTGKCIQRIRRTSGTHRRWWTFLKFMCEIYEAFPKRTYLFLLYLIAIMATHLQLVKSTADFAFVSIFVIAADRIQAAWKEEKSKITRHGKKAVREFIRIVDDKKNVDS